MELFTKWGRLETGILCTHVLHSHQGAQRWADPSRKIGCSQPICALRWHAAFIRNRQRCKPAGIQWYTAWELGVLLLGSDYCQSLQMKRKDMYTVLAGWLPGRSAEGAKQALAAHVAGKEAAVRQGLQQMQLPCELLPLLEAWVQLPMQQKRHAMLCPHWDAEAAASCIVEELKAEQQLEQQRKLQQHEREQKRLKQYKRASSPAASQASDAPALSAGSPTLNSSSSSGCRSASPAAAASLNATRSSTSSQTTAAAGAKVKKRQRERQTSSKLQQRKRTSKQEVSQPASQHSRERSSSSTLSELSSSSSSSHSLSAATATLPYSTGKPDAPAAAGGHASAFAAAQYGSAALPQMRFELHCNQGRLDPAAPAPLLFDGVQQAEGTTSNSSSSMWLQPCCSAAALPASNVEPDPELVDFMLGVYPEMLESSSGMVKLHSATGAALPTAPQHQQTAALTAATPDVPQVCRLLQPALGCAPQQHQHELPNAFLHTIQEQQAVCTGLFSDEGMVEWLLQRGDTPGVQQQQQQQQQLPVAVPGSGDAIAVPICQAAGHAPNSASHTVSDVVSGWPAQQQQQPDVLQCGPLLLPPQQLQPWWVDVEQAAAGEFQHDVLAYELSDDDALLLPPLIDLLES